MHKKALTTYEIAEHCQVTPRTVIQWINEGKIKAYRTPGNHSRVQAGDFLDFLRKYNMPLPESDIVSNNKKHILIVDDDKEMVDAMYRILNHERIYELDVAYDGFEAGEKFTVFKPDLVLLDIKMPGLSGVELCARIRRNPLNKHVKILLVSGGIDQKESLLMKTSGADGYLEKPFRNDDLKRRIKEVLERV